MTDTRTLDEQLAHCDGADCTCLSCCESECVCDADWTPRAVYEMRAEIERLSAPPARLNLQREGAHPPPCARHCEAMAVELEVRNLRERGDSLAARLAKVKKERDALRQRIGSAPLLTATRNGVIRTGVGAFPPGAKVRLVVEDAV